LLDEENFDILSLMQKNGKLPNRVDASKIKRAEELPEEFQKPLNKSSRPLKSDKDRKPIVSVPAKVEKREDGPSTPKGVAKSSGQVKE